MKRVRQRLLERERPPYALPTLFTVGTLFCGYYCLMKTVQAMSLPPEAAGQAAQFFDAAAKAIGIAVFTDGVDGRIARATGATSEFGKEIDSLADCITFGVAPATLAFAWGIRTPEMMEGLWLAQYLPSLGYFIAFLYLTCGAARLARFNVQKNPRPKNPGRPGRGYFVGLPIPAAAGMLAAVIHFRQGDPISSWWPGGVLWTALIGLLAFLMVCTWRYSSFKGMNLMRRPSVGVIFLASIVYLIWNFSEPVLLLMATTFVGSGIVTRLTWLWKKDKPQAPDGPSEEPSEEPTEQPT